MNAHSNKIEAISAEIRTIPDFPKPGILFRDITTLLSNGPLFHDVIDLFAERYQPQAIDQIVGIDARGFIFGSALAYQLGIGFIPVRKPGKLPFKTIDIAYELEYGRNSPSIHADALHQNDRVVIIDDLLATGGTAAASIQLVEKLGATIVEMAFLIELSALNARECLGNHSVFSLIQYED